MSTTAPGTPLLDQTATKTPSSSWGIWVLGGLCAFPIVFSRSLYAYSSSAFIFATGLVVNHLLSPRETRYHPSRTLARLLLACGIALLALATSALANWTLPSIVSIPGLLSLLAYLAAFSLLSRSEAFAIKGIFITSAALCVATVAFGPPIVMTSPEAMWKYGLAIPATVCILSLVTRARFKFLTPLTLGIIGSGSIAFGSRSFGGICLIVGIVLLLIYAIPSRRILILVVTPMILLGGYAGLSLAIDDGIFGSAVQQKAVWQQSQGNSILLVGRAEVILSATVIINRPIMGAGSVNAIQDVDIEQGLENAGSWAGMSPAQAMDAWFPNNDGGSANLHSILLSAWVEGGIIAVVPLVGILVLLWRAAVRAGPRFQAMYVFMALLTSWSFLFSPWSYGLMQLVAASVVAASLSEVNSAQSATRDCGSNGVSGPMRRRVSAGKVP
jgi:hypothetical protein